MLFDRLPGPPTMAEIRTTNVWIVEWLSPGEEQTGRLLHEWIQNQRPGWSVYSPCENKAQVIQAIQRAATLAQSSEMVPVLHLEAHGHNDGLAPDKTGRSEFLTWGELTEPLQQLNLATRCNLVVVLAACIGFAGIQTFCKGPRAPAVALVGLGGTVYPGDLLWGTKEFYRRWQDKNPSLADITASASRDAGTVSFEWEPFAVFAYEVQVENLIKSVRPTERIRRKEKFRQRMLNETGLSVPEIERRLAQLPHIGLWEVQQMIWDKMFMIDLYPSNRERFGVDMKAIVELIMETALP